MPICMHFRSVRLSHQTENKQWVHELSDQGMEHMIKEHHQFSQVEICSRMSELGERPMRAALRVR